MSRRANTVLVERICKKITWSNVQRLTSFVVIPSVLLCALFISRMASTVPSRIHLETPQSWTVLNVVPLCALLRMQTRV